ncbi:MAG: exo-alpha-sialidase, partial [Acidobacteriaceae bacterium]|nr:exo-alpha-sialidase [Acidobacteriaceae bacterium]
LVAEPDKWTGPAFPQDIISQGMFVFNSTDGGASWSPIPVPLEQRQAGDDKQWATADNNPSSKFHGTVYAVWGANTPLWFARKLPGENGWIGAGTDSSPTAIFEDAAFAPAICVSGDGTIHIAWHVPQSEVIFYMSSSDGGKTFSDPELCVEGMGDIDEKFATPDVLDPLSSNFATFPGGTFRVMTLVSIAPIGQSGCIIAWADARDAFTRIYYRVRSDTGTWLGDDSGTPLLGKIGFPDTTEVQHFHPQLAVTPNGTIGCAFYEFGLSRDGRFRIDVRLASSAVLADGFFFLVTVTEKPWDPLVDAPFSHGPPDQPNLTFIGEYFGLDTSDEDFCVLWTDTRTGHQELWFSRVATSRVAPRRPPRLQPGLVGQLIGGVAVDGGGWVILDGYPHPIPPSGPVTEILQLLAANALIEGVSEPAARQIERMIFRTIADIAAREGRGGEVP